MMLVQETVFGRVDKVQKAIDYLKSFEPQEGYYLAFSGGKDSQCIYHLAKMAGVKFDAHYSITTVDPPELMRFVRDHYPDVEWERHYWPDSPKFNLPSGKRRQITMWNLIAYHTVPPTRQNRYCCADLKETSGVGRIVITGTRWAESVRRRDLHGLVDMRTSSKKLIQNALESNDAAKLNNRGSLIFMDDNDETKKIVEQCYLKRRTTVNPIIDWEDDDVWEFLNDVAKVPHCCLYDEGYTRLGCIGCPLAGREKMLTDFERWPRYKELYIRAFDNMIKNHPNEIRVATGEPAEINGGGYYSTVGRNGSCDKDTDVEEDVSGVECGLLDKQYVGATRERERERESNKVFTLVDVDAQNFKRTQRTESSSRLVMLYGLSPTIHGTMLDYWLWLCRSNPKNLEPKPLPALSWESCSITDGSTENVTTQKPDILEQ